MPRPFRSGAGLPTVILVPDHLGMPAPFPAPVAAAEVTEVTEVTERAPLRGR